MNFLRPGYPRQHQFIGLIGRKLEGNRPERVRMGGGQVGGSAPAADVPAVSAEGVGHDPRPGIGPSGQTALGLEAGQRELGTDEGPLSPVSLQVPYIGVQAKPGFTVEGLLASRSVPPPSAMAPKEGVRAVAIELDDLGRPFQAAPLDDHPEPVDHRRRSGRGRERSRRASPADSDSGTSRRPAG